MDSKTWLSTAHEIRRLAVEAGVAPETVKRYIRGERMRSTTLARIEQAARALGYRLGRVS